MTSGGRTGGGRGAQRLERWARQALPLLALCCASERAGRADDAAPRPGEDPSALLCGGAGEACCAASRFGCARGLLCDDAEGICRVASDVPGAARSCRRDEECAPTGRCCSAGAYGTCQALEPGAACSLPDVTLLVSGAGVTVEQDVFDGVTPSQGGCVREPGMRHRLRVPVAIANFGEADFILGGPDLSLQGQASAGEDFLRYSLLDASGAPVATSHGPLPCSESEGPAHPFTCAFAGLAAGALEPALGLECEALDVTGLPAGPYRVRVELAREWPDADPSNGRVEMPVVLPSFDPLDPCPPVDNPLLGLGSVRECGWSHLTSLGDGTCVPGEFLSLDCGGCSGSPMLRLCAGDTACTVRSALATGGVHFLTPTGDIADPCTGIQGTCPPIGRYNVLVGSEDPSLVPSCTLAFTPGF